MMRDLNLRCYPGLAQRKDPLNSASLFHSKRTQVKRGQVKILGIALLQKKAVGRLSWLTPAQGIDAQQRWDPSTQQPPPQGLWTCVDDQHLIPPSICAFAPASFTSKHLSPCAS